MDGELPTGEEIITIHEKIEEDYDMKYRGARVAAPRLRFDELVQEIAATHEDVYDHAAALLRDCLTAHYFEDGNKRTAWVVTREYLTRHGLTPAQTETEDVEPVLKTIRRYDVAELSDWLESGEIDESRFNP